MDSVFPRLRPTDDGHRQLVSALRRKEFVLHYQPKVNMVTGAVCGAEALIRWEHPDLGLVPPAGFLPAVTGTPLETSFGNYVIEAALEQIVDWKRQGVVLPVSVNIGPHQLQAAGFVESLRALLDRHPGVSPGDLQFEILESSAIGDMRSALSAIEACREMGIVFALDDFGTGYSSLAHLRTLPVDILKIDQSFVRAMLDDNDDLGMVALVVHIAQTFNRVVVAEGVETARHGALLVELACHVGQGYGIAVPMPAERLPAWIEHWSGPAGWRFAEP